MINYEKIDVLNDKLKADLVELSKEGEILNIGNIQEDDQLSGSWFRFKKKDKVIGYGWLTFNGRAEISFFINKQYRGAKIAKEIIKNLENEAIRKHISHTSAIILYTNPFRHQVISLLFNLGYRFGVEFTTIEEILNHSDNLASRGYDTPLSKELYTPQIE